MSGWGSGAQDWRKGAPNNAVVATSVVAIVVREGNPKNIRTWDDLVRCARGHVGPCPMRTPAPPLHLTQVSPLLHGYHCGSPQPG